MPDAFHIFSMNEVIASLSYNIYRGQIHVITNPKKEKIQPIIQEGKEYNNCQVTQKVKSAKQFFTTIGIL